MVLENFKYGVLKCVNMILQIIGTLIYILWVYTLNLKLS